MWGHLGVGHLVGRWGGGENGHISDFLGSNGASGIAARALWKGY